MKVKKRTLLLIAWYPYGQLPDSMYCGLEFWHILRTFLRLIFYSPGLSLPSFNILFLDAL